MTPSTTDPDLEKAVYELIDSSTRNKLAEEMLMLRDALHNCKNSATLYKLKYEKLKDSERHFRQSLLDIYEGLKIIYGEESDRADEFKSAMGESINMAALLALCFERINKIEKD